MRRPFAFLLTLSAAIAAVTTGGVSALADPTTPRPIAQVVGHIAGAKMLAAPWYNPTNHALGMRIDGTGPVCSVQAVFERKEDGTRYTLVFGAMEPPAVSGATFPGPLGMLPGTYSVVVNGAVTGPAFPACSGSAQVGPVVVDETITGKNYPKIAGAKWEGATRGGGTIGVYDATSKGDKFLDVAIVNYLDGAAWTSPSALIVHPVCALTVNLAYSVVDVHGAQQDMHLDFWSAVPLVLPVTAGQSPSFGQVITPGPGGATFRANITAIVARYKNAASKGDVFTITIASTPKNNAENEAPCMGKATAVLHVD
jgi:hypothetical protein